MNEDYKASLAAHNTQQDLTWWDQNYGMLINIILYFISFSFIL
jgi:hypothetical protein